MKYLLLKRQLLNRLEWPGRAAVTKLLKNIVVPQAVEKVELWQNQASVQLRPILKNAQHYDEQNPDIQHQLGHWSGPVIVG